MKNLWDIAVAIRPFELYGIFLGMCLLTVEMLETYLQQSCSYPLKGPPTMPYRHIPSNRRPGETRTFDIDGHIAEATINVYGDSGFPCELFLSSDKPGSSLAFLLEDAAVIISIALQHGINPRVLAKSMSKAPTYPQATRPATILGEALTWLVEEYHKAEETSASSASIPEPGP